MYDTLVEKNVEERWNGVATRDEYSVAQSSVINLAYVRTVGTISVQKIEI
jgi:hypothetical protein